MKIEQLAEKSKTVIAVSIAHRAWSFMASEAAGAN